MLSIPWIVAGLVYVGVVNVISKGVKFNKTVDNTYTYTKDTNSFNKDELEKWNKK